MDLIGSGLGLMAGSYKHGNINEIKEDHPDSRD
jgi:hypothetical protein